MKISVAELAKAVAGELTGDGTRTITRVVHPDDVTDDTHIAFAGDKKYLPSLTTSRATAAIVGTDAEVPAHITTIIRVPWAKRALVEITQMFATKWSFEAGIHPSAVIHPTAMLGANVSVGAFCFVGAGTIIGDNTVLQPQSYAGARTTFGADCFIFTGARILDDTQMGARCIIHPNAVIGSDGFSFVTAEKGSVEAFKGLGGDKGAVQGDILRIASLGPVIIGDDVEIGSGTTIDRATLRTTRIGNGTKIDNQVQIGHNVQIGNNVRICGQAGVAGSVIIGDRAVLAAASGIADNVQIGEDAIVGANAGVGGNVPAKTVVMGMPAQPQERAHATWMAQMRLPRMMQELEELKSRLKMLEEQTKNG